MENKQHQLAGHPLGLFILFFTEMWERFSYYGMRVLFVYYLTGEIIGGGQAWSRADANSLYSWYTGLVYLTPMLGGFLADRYLGFKKAIIIGGLIMTLGHIVLAFEPVPAFYIGCLLLIFGNGLFKPNISSMVGQLYPDGPKAAGIKDAGYTIFYMGVNTGAYLGILLCGYIGENIGWHYGFGLAGIFMFFGTVQFYFAKKFFGKIGEKPEPKEITASTDKEKASNKLTKEEKDRLIVVAVLSFFTIFFWFAFEQAGTSMSIFARDYTQRSLETETANTAFKIINTIIALIPTVVISWLWVNLVRKIGKQYPMTIVAITISVLSLASLIFWMLRRQYMQSAIEVDASWFQTLNSLFIVLFAPAFSVLWKKLSTSKYNPSAATKFAIGFFLLGIGFLMLVVGSSAIPKGAMTAKVSMAWLCFAYLFHTLGELSISPVGLSYVSKLTPPRLIGMMFGIWFFCTFLGNLAAGQTASLMDKISASMSMSGFFQIFVYVPFAAGFVLLVLNRVLKKKVHGVS